MYRKALGLEPETESLGSNNSKIKEPRILFAGSLLLFVLFFLCSATLAFGNLPAKTANDYTEAIDFTLLDLEGNMHALSDYKGKKVFLNFWATWCPPCRAEMPAMQSLYDTWDREDFVMLAVNINQQKEEVEAFMLKNHYAFPILLDSDGKVAGDYNVRGIPTTFFINSAGEIQDWVVGAREWDLDQVKDFFK